MILSNLFYRKAVPAVQVMALSLGVHLSALEPSCYDGIEEPINTLNCTIAEAVMLKNSEQVSLAVDNIFNMINSCAHSSETEKEHCKRKCHNKITYICQEDLNESGYVINEPGEYRFAEDLVFNPRISKIKRSAITINSSNVFLSLNHKTLKQGSHRAKATIGIEVRPFADVVIEAGNIVDFTRWGVSIAGARSVAVQNLNILRCGSTEGTRLIFPEDIPTGALSAVVSQNLLLHNINAFQSMGVGIYAESVQEAILSKCYCNYTSGGTYFGVQTGNISYGICFYARLPEQPASKNILIVDSEANYTTGGAIVTGIGFFNGLPVPDPKYFENINLLNCRANHTVNGDAQEIESDATGIALVRTKSFSCTNCTANYNQHPFPPATTALPGLNSSTGFSINLSSDGRLENCTANENQGQGQTCEGVRIRDCNQITLKNCTASNNFNTYVGATPGDAWGFRTDPLLNFGAPEVGVNYVFDSCVSQNNVAASGDCGGFKAVNLIDSKFINCISQGQKDFLPGDPTQLRQAWGILAIDVSAFNSVNNLFEYNEVQGNSVAGIQDNTLALNAYLGNIARGNTTNFVGLPTGTPIAIWTIGSPAPIVTAIDNLDIRP